MTEFIKNHHLIAFPADQHSLGRATNDRPRLDEGIEKMGINLYLG